MILSSTNVAGNRFWEFSLKFYSREDVSSSCLTLQNNFGADVNILIYCCWMAVEGAEKISCTELVEIITILEPWQSKVVTVLREIRTSMKQDKLLNLGALSEELRKAVKKCELESEKIEQNILYQSGQNISVDISLNRFQKAQNAKLSLENYLQVLLGNESKKAKNFIDIISSELVITNY
jgi:uncharacterized protein (TIGR02444 family)